MSPLRTILLALLASLLAVPAAAQEAVEDEPTVDEPEAVDEPAVDEPEAVDEPAVDEPAVDEPPRPRPQPRLLLQPGQLAGGEEEPAEDYQLPEAAEAAEAEDDAWDEEGWDEPLDDEAADDALDRALEEGLIDDEEGAAIDDHFGDENDPAHAAHGEHEPHADEHGVGADPTEDHAAHEEFDPVQFGATALNFLIWLAIIVWLLRKPLGEHLAGRRRDVEEGLVEAERLEKEAKVKHAEYSERLAHLDEELDKLRKEMVQVGEAERDRIIADAEARAARMRKDATFLIEQQMKQLRADLTREAIEAAVAAAETALAAQVGGSDHERLAEAYLGQLKTSLDEEEGRAS